MTAVAAMPLELDDPSVTDFVDTEIVPNVEEYDELESIPDRIIDGVGQLGLWAPFLPRTVGGRGMDWVRLGWLHEEIGRGCSSLRSLLTVHSMVAASVHRWGSAAQRRTWLADMASGQIRGSFCLTEAAGGSASSVDETTAAQTDDGWLLNGTKLWITGGQTADVYLVFARTNAGMGAFLVPREVGGVTVMPISGALGTRASMLADIAFDDVRLRPEGCLGEHPGWDARLVMTTALELGRYSVASGCVGIIQSCLDNCVRFSTHRQIDAGLLADLPPARRELTDMIVGLRTARLLLREVGRLKDARDPGAFMAGWEAKYYASKVAHECTSAAVELFGGRGYRAKEAVGRLWRDAKVARNIEGPTYLQHSTIAGQFIGR